MLGQYCEVYSELKSIMVSKIHCTKMMVICYFMENLILKFTLNRKCLVVLPTSS